MNVEGRLQGVLLGLVNARLSMGFVKSQMLILDSSVERIMSQLDYNLERILVLDVSPARLLVHVRQLDGEVSLELSHLKGCLSKTALVSLMKVKQKYVTFFKSVWSTQAEVL